MKNCYREEVLYFNNPIFTNIPVTIVITMNGSSRRSSYMNQLANYPLTKKVIILHNEGYKKCNKKNVSNTALDLWHANVYASKLAKGDCAIILEDDVEFLPRLYDEAGKIEEFVMKFPNKPSAYHLGCMPHISFMEKDHLHIKIGTTSHACIYNASALEIFPSIKIYKLHDLELSRFFDIWTCQLPCAIQKFTNTENSKQWNHFGIAFLLIRILTWNGDSVTCFENAHYIGKFGGIWAIILLLFVIIILIFVIILRIFNYLI